MEASVNLWTIVRALEGGAFIVGWKEDSTIRIVFPGIDAHIDVWVADTTILFTRGVVLGTECHVADSPVATALDNILDLPHVNRQLAPHVRIAVQSS